MGRAESFPNVVQVTEMLGELWAGEARRRRALCARARIPQPVLEADGGASPDPRPSQNDFMVG